MLLDRRKNPSNQLPNNLSILSGEEVNLNDHSQFWIVKSWLRFGALFGCRFMRDR